MTVPSNGSKILSGGGGHDSEINPRNQENFGPYVERTSESSPSGDVTPEGRVVSCLRTELQAGLLRPSG